MGDPRVDSANRVASNLIDHVTIDGDLSNRDEASIRETLKAFSPEVQDALITQAKETAEKILGKFNTIAASGTLGALTEPSPANVRKVMNHYTTHKAESLVADNKNWGGLNLKEDALGEDLADFVREDPRNADRVIKSMMAIGGPAISHSNRIEVARYVVKNLSVDEMIDNLSWRTLTNLHDRLSRICLREETRIDHRRVMVSTMSQGKPDSEDTKQIARLEQALSSKPRPANEPLQTSWIL